MHPVFLILLALAMWAMGYRFFGKFLRLAMLQVDANGARAAAPGRLTLGAVHAAAATGLLSIIGAAIAVVWGWVPAFLWVVLASMIAATVLAVGVLWTTVQRAGDSLAGVAFDLAGLPAALMLFFMGVVLLVLVGATLGNVLGDLVDAHPESAWALLALLVAGVPGRGDGNPARRHGGAVLLVLAAVLVGLQLPLQLSGDWSLSLRGVALFTLPHELLWTLAALAMAYRALGAPDTAARDARGVVTVLLALAVLALFLAGTAVQGNALDAPQFNSVAALPAAPVLLFIVVTGGALSGMHALVASGLTARHTPAPRDIMRTGYFGVGLDSLVAVMVIVALVAGFSDTTSWQAVYGSWPAYGGLYVWLDLAITHIAYAISALGIPLPWSIALVATLCVALALSMLETALRLLGGSVDEFVQDFEFDWARGPHFKQQAATLLIGVATLLIAQSGANLQHWLLLGITNQWFACLVLVLLGMALWRARRPALLCWAPLLIIGPLTLWGTVWVMLEWQAQGDWGLLGTGAAVCLGGLVFLTIAARSVARLRRELAAAPTADPRF